MISVFKMLIIIFHFFEIEKLAKWACAQNIPKGLRDVK